MYLAKLLPLLFTAPQEAHLIQPLLFFKIKWDEGMGSTLSVIYVFERDVI